MENHQRLPIKSIKSLGTSWHNRGFGYWARRAVFVIYALIGCAFSFSIVGVFLYLVITHLRDNTGLSVTLLVICVPTILASLYYGLKPLRRTPEQRAEGRPMTFGSALSRNQRIGVGAGAGAAGYAASSGSGIASGAAFFGAFAFLGHCVGNLIVSCQKYLTQAEFEAVRDAERRR
ncbi:hypothetical protein [Gordonia sp. DT101]|uniref:hypothetical protein n=1 Tax=Gordonia sp. DT101 TaxID=3416545 RepID=UPI003CF9D144